MGLYTTVFANQASAKCRATFRADVQFKTGHENGNLPEYVEGDEAAEIPEGTYGGIVDAYCQGCSADWVAAEKRAGFEVLATAVRRGGTTVRKGVIVRGDDYLPLLDANNEFAIEYLQAPPITPEELEAHGRSPETGPARPNFAARLGLINYVIHENAKRTFPGRGTDTSGFFARLQSSVDKRLVAAGWEFGSTQWVDITIDVDEHRVIRVVASQID